MNKFHLFTGQNEDKLQLDVNDSVKFVTLRGDIDFLLLHRQFNQPLLYQLDFRTMALSELCSTSGKSISVVKETSNGQGVVVVFQNGDIEILELSDTLRAVRKIGPANGVPDPIISLFNHKTQLLEDPRRGGAGELRLSRPNSITYNLLMTRKPLVYFLSKLG